MATWGYIYHYQAFFLKIHEDLQLLLLKRHGSLKRLLLKIYDKLI